MVDIEGHAVDEVDRQDSGFYEGLFHETRGPDRGETHICSDSCSYVGVRLCQLDSGPHVPVAKEELGPPHFLASPSHLGSHLEEVVVETLEFSLVGLVLDFEEFLVGEEVAEGGHSHSEVRELVQEVFEIARHFARLEEVLSLQEHSLSLLH